MTLAVTPAMGKGRERKLTPQPNSELRGLDMDRQQFELATYNEPDPTPAWIRPYYVCGCGFECIRKEGDPFLFVRVPHKCRLDE